MALPTEAVTSAGSGLVFINSYDASVSEPYREAAIAAEQQLQAHFTNATTISVKFVASDLGQDFAAQNSFSLFDVSYSTFATALRTHAVSSDDLIAAGGLPASDPSRGAGFEIPMSEARILGLAAETSGRDVTVTLNSTLPWTYGQDAIGAIQHEITEGGFGRISSLGLTSTRWEPLDLFRFDGFGVRDYTGGSDGALVYFGLDGAHVLNRIYHNSLGADGQLDNQDLGDWDTTSGDAFGPGGPAGPGAMSATDWRVLDVLGWNNTPYTPAADEFANSLSDTSHPFGQLAPGGSTTGALQSAGDRDWFQVQLQAGSTYAIKLAGHDSSAGTLADPYLRLHDASGAQVAVNDDQVSGTVSDSLIDFTAPASGTYYIEAGAFADGYAGSYTVSVSTTSQGSGGGGQATSGADSLQASAASTSLDGGAGDDTIVGWSGGDYLRGGDGNDSILGGSGFDDINGNKGNDVIDGGSGGDDWLVGGQGDDLITAHAGGNILYGNLGNDTLNGGSGNEILRGGQGDDSIAGGAGNDWISGDRGNDTLSGGAGADTFHTFSGAGIDKVTDFNAAEGDRVMVDPGTHYTVSQVGADTVVDMGNGDQMILVGVQMSTLPNGWIFGA